MTKPLDRDSFNADLVRRWKAATAEENGWRKSLMIHHGTDSITAQEIIAAGFFRSEKDWPSFFTTNKKEAQDYARIRAGQMNARGKDARPYVFSLRVPAYAVHLNKGSGEVETHAMIPLYIREHEGYIRDVDILASEAAFSPDDPNLSYDAYLKDFAQGGEATERKAVRLDGDVLVPEVQRNQVIGQKPLKDLPYWPLLATYQYLRSKRDKKSRELYKLVEAWGERMQQQAGEVAEVPFEVAFDKDEEAEREGVKVSSVPHPSSPDYVDYVNKAEAWAKNSALHALINSGGLTPEGSAFKKEFEKTAGSALCDWLQPTTKAVSSGTLVTALSANGQPILDILRNKWGMDVLRAEKPIPVFYLKTANLMGGTLDKERGEKHAKLLAEEMRAGKQFAPIVLAEFGMIVDGYHRLRAAQIAGLELVPCVCLDAFTKKVES